MARNAEPLEALTLLRMPHWKAELFRRAARRSNMSNNQLANLALDDFLYKYINEGRRYDNQGVLRQTIGDKGT